MPSMRIDLMGGTLTVGVASFMADRAIREAKVYGVPLDNTMLDAAVAFCIADPQVNTLVHQANQSTSNIPLSRIHAWRFGMERGTGLASVNLRLEYGRRSRGRFPPNGFNVASFRDASRSTPWYRLPFNINAQGTPVFTANRPSGDLSFPRGGGPNDPAVPPDWYMWNQTGYRIFVPRLLTSIPFAHVQQTQKINANTVTFAGAQFDPFTVKFDSLTFDWEIENGQTIYPAQYVFTALTGGWYNQIVRWLENPLAPGSFSWATTDGLAYQTTSGGVFTL